MTASPKNNSKGFTLIEMLVATAVFSVVLMVCGIALLQISRTFYKGVTITNTQEVARLVIDEISGSVSFSAGDIQPLVANSGSEGYCVGNLRYSFKPGQMLADDNTQHAFVVDRLDDLPTPLLCSSSVQALDLSAGALPNNPRELLSPRMRVSKFSIINQGNRLYSISLKLATGDDDLLSNPTLATAQCSGFMSGSQFCSVVELTTVVQKRLQ